MFTHSFFRSSLTVFQFFIPDGNITTYVTSCFCSSLGVTSFFFSFQENFLQLFLPPSFLLMDSEIAQHCFFLVFSFDGASEFHPRQLLLTLFHDSYRIPGLQIPTWNMFLLSLVTVCQRQICASKIELLQRLSPAIISQFCSKVHIVSWSNWDGDSSISQDEARRESSAEGRCCSTCSREQHSKTGLWSKSNLSRVASPPPLVRALLLGFYFYFNNWVKSLWSIKPR